MRLSTLYNLFIISCLVVFSCQKMTANHAMAVDLTYECLAQDVYEVQLTFYLDCGSSIITEPPAAPLLSVSSANCGESSVLLLTPITENWGAEVSQLCTEVLENGESNCENGELAGVRQYRYNGFASLPQTCTDWTFSYRLEDNETRSETITNLVNPDFYSIYVEAKLNNTLGCNSSPTFNSLPVAYFCEQNSTFTLGTIETDGDELVFSLVQPLDNVISPIPYFSVFSAEQPIAASNFDFDATSGQINFLPTTTQRPVVAILIEEYRNGEFVGSVIRDMQFVILDCENQHVQATLPNSSNFEVCQNETLTFNIDAFDYDDADIILFETNVSELNGAVFEQNIILDAVEGVFSWTPTTADVGEHTLELYITDNACPISSHLYYTFQINVLGNFNLSNDTFYQCVGANPLIIELSGGSEYIWSPTAGLTFLETDGSLVEINNQGNIGETTNYNITTNCGETADISVLLAETFNLQAMEDISICQNQTTNLSGTVDGNVSNYSFLWSPNENLNNENSLNATATPSETTTYFLTATSLTNGCSVTDSVLLTVAESSTNVTLTASQDTICEGESVNLNASVAIFSELTCGINGSYCENTANIYDIGGGTTTSFEPTPFYGLWESYRLQMLYRQDEMQVMGMTSGIINSIGFNVTDLFSGGTTVYNDFTIRISCVNNEDLNNFQSGLQDVFYAADYTVNDSWNVFVLDNTYDWDGESNLLIEVCYTNDNSGIFDEISASITNYNSVVYDYSSNTQGCTLGNATTSDIRPDIRFGLCVYLPNVEPTISWSPAESLSDSSIENPIATPSETTTYTVSFSNDGCIGNESITIFVQNADDMQALPDTSVCVGETVPLYLSGNVPNTATFEWSPSENLSDATAQNPTTTLENTTTFSLTVSYNDDCNTVFTDSVTVEVVPLSVVYVTPDTAIKNGETIELEIIGEFTHVDWFLGNENIASHTANVSVTPLQTTTYTVEISNILGCTETRNITVRLVEDCESLLIPTAFSPNNDGVNDTFSLLADSYDELLEFQIYNRWGILVFDALTESKMFWNGEFREREQEIGSYVYFVKAQCGEKVLEQKGVFTIIR